MNYFSEIALIVSFFILFFLGFTKKEKYNLKLIKKINIIVASLLLLVWLFHDILAVTEAFREGFNSAGQ